MKVIGHGETGAVHVEIQPVHAAEIGQEIILQLVVVPQELTDLHNSDRVHLDRGLIPKVDHIVHCIAEFPAKPLDRRP
jgi:hypothetical protein